MQAMFFKARDFNQNINYWNVKKVKNMCQMFYRATNYDKPLDKWDISSVKNISHMIYETPYSKWCNQSEMI